MKTEELTFEDLVFAAKVNFMTNTTSLNTLLVGQTGDPADSETELQEMVPDVGPSPQEIVEQDELRKTLQKALQEALSPREYTIIVWRFGLLDGEPKPLSVVANHYGICRERVRQIEAKALNKLRKSKYFKEKLGGYFNDGI